MTDHHGPLVAAETVFEHVDEDDWVVFDCRHDLMDRQAGPLAYADEHIPGAHHAHVDDDLSGPVGDGQEGRHPLPDPAAFRSFLRRHGVSEDSQVVAYDEGPGMWAARLWWLLRHYGHTNVAVLDGGLARWKALKLPTRGGDEPRHDGDFEGDPGVLPTVATPDVEAALGDGIELVDVRAPERYRGDEEPIDPVAGHIPGARSLPYTANLDPEGMWLSPDELRSRYEHLDDPVVYCGSGVTAAHAVLAMDEAGLPPPRLYTGSWSAWCHPSGDRPVEKGGA